MVRSVPLQSEQVAPPQTHRPGAVPDSAFMRREDHVFDLQLTVLQSPQRDKRIEIIVSNAERFITERVLE